ncbi:hypothetical protein TVAG_331370 [Trichomonas vaginalis G3]|uniref:Uncharacterized protein n=1 Tax=Trichomonas vaginalis (strain ATCC PRA-98 / G3) TaxID=412133 RepID=A2FRJ9_TRIV3|nr:hypothetical protein TVAGG3_1060970 [Trichomonas vaginalis G3]EAX92461.1 hypothetical protein TVAG_331370 [Trichomonas vaginalis G3]KAI5494684.1 hypothetical protein TVAGG3_1060970 [Trichomonas vaginalis G3]|eukprot:XP_001305391.1 hypothetical protein [Trichomonas vaginalis G3]
MKFEEFQLNKLWRTSLIILIGLPILCFFFQVEKDEILVKISLQVTNLIEHKIYYIANSVRNINFFPNENFDHVLHFRDNYNYPDTIKKFNGKFPNQQFPPYSLPIDWQSYNISYAFLRNVHVSRSPSIITPKGRYADTPFHWLPQIQGPTTGKVVYHFDYAIAPGHSFCDSFGHFHIDYFPCILIMPQKIIKTYKILNVPNLEFIHEAFVIIGVPRENRIPPLQINELAFCDIVIYPFTMNYYELCRKVFPKL